MKNVFLCLLLLIVALTACQNNQKQQPSEAEIEKMVNERVEAKLAEKAKEQATNPTQDNMNVDETSDKIYSSSSSSSPSSKSDKEKKQYERGKKRGISSSLDLEFYLKDDEKNMKDTYRMFLEIEDATNRALYEEFKRGFIDGYKLKNAL